MSGWYSLERRLPALVLLLLLVVVALISVMAYRGLEAALTESAGQHVDRVSRELSTLLAQSARSMQREADALASRREVAAAVGGSAADRERATQTFSALATHRATVGVGIAAREEAAWLVWVSGKAADSVSPAIRSGGDPTEIQSGVGPIRADGEALYFDTSSRIDAAPAGADARIVIRTHLAETGAGRLLGEILGPEAVFLVGSEGTGAVWSDLDDPMTAPIARGEGRYEWDGRTFEGAAAPIEGTPWQAWVGLPRGQVLAPANALVRRMAGVGGLILLLGTMGAILLGRHVGHPISMLTQAVEGISSGRYHERVPVRSRDEIGRLAAAFNVMADRVEESTLHLEAQVEQRTRQLEATLNELRQTQEQLVRREKLAMLGQLASGVGHELRNPLGVMTNAVYYLEMVSPDATPDVKEYLAILRTQVALAEKIVADLLDFSRVRPPRRDAVRLETLLEEQLIRLASLNGVEVAREYEPGVRPASIDGVQVGQILFNLMTNAVQAMGEQGGRMTLRTKACSDGRVAISVSDTGPGIPTGDLERVFEPLYTTKARGIGLGLAVSRSLAEANEGELAVESEPGSGTTFTVTLPAVTA